MQLQEAVVTRSRNRGGNSSRPIAVLFECVGYLRYGIACFFTLFIICEPTLTTSLFGQAASLSPTPSFRFAAFGNANTCGAVTLTGNSQTDSFTSSRGMYSSTRETSGGDIGANGNISLSGSVRINGAVASPHSGTGACGPQSLTGLTTNGGALASGGLVLLQPPVSYADPPPPTPLPPTTDQNLSGNCGGLTGCTAGSDSKNLSLAPGQYGNLNVTGGTTVHLRAGTYNINTLALRGDSTLVVDSPPVVLNFAGQGLNNNGTVLEFTGGGLINSVGAPDGFEIWYAGAAQIKLSGGASSYGVVYAPKAPISLNGGTDWYGALIGYTITGNGVGIHYDRSLGAGPLTVTAVPDHPPNAAGWNNTDVAVTFTCSGGINPVSCPTPVKVTTEGANQQISGKATDAIGTTATATIVINLDKTPPTITPSQAPLPNVAGWNNTDVTVSFLASDSLSGIASATPPIIVRTEGANQFTNGTAVDVAGNTSTVQAAVSVDKTPPVTQNAVSPKANANGWNNTNVTVSFTGTDSLSGIANCAAPVTLTNEGTNQTPSGTCADVAGNVSALSRSIGINIDKTPPTIGFSTASPAPNAAGWNNTDVEFPFTATDTLSGIDTTSTPSPLVLRTEGAAETGSVTVMDRAGNNSTFKTSAVKIDKTPPTINFGAPTPIANPAGWNNTSVSVPFTATDGLSGVGSTSPPSPLSLTTEGTSVTESVTVTDIAGNSATLTSPPVKIDRTAPTVQFSVSPPRNANGWNNKDVTVTFTGTDSLSGIANCSPDNHLQNEGTNQTASGACTDNAGNVSAAATATGINIDKTPPTVTFGAATPEPNAAGWNKTDVSIPFTPADSLSGVGSSSVSSPLSLTSEGTSVTASVTVTDLAGNTATFTSPEAKVDKTPPTLTFGTATPAPNGAGWNNTNVSFSFSAADGLSGVASTSVPSPLSVSSEGVSVNGSVMVMDVAGNSATFTTPGVKIDKTRPTAQAGALPSPNPAGWNKTDVKVTFTGNDTLSGIASCTPEATVTTEGANQSASGTCVDNAGNVSATATASNINLDKTPPTLTFGSFSPAPNAAGWNKADVSVPFTPADNLSGVASLSVPSPLLLTTEGASITGAVTLTDVAGNTATFTSPAAKIDKTAPTLTFGTATPAANAAGWNNSNVSFPLTATDGLSGVGSTSVPSPLSLDVEGSAVNGSVTVIDVAGNSATFTSPSVKIDKTPPTTQGTASPPPNAAGWNKSDVTVSFTGTDGLSGIAGCSPSVILNTEGANQSKSGTCTDNAGNVSQPAMVTGINLDKTPPTLTFGTATPSANGSGWNNTDVTFAFTTTDNLSGVDSTSVPSPLSLTLEGSSVNRSVTVTDVAGNSATVTSPTVKIDKTAPTVQATASPTPNGAGWNKTDVTVSFAGADSLSGIAACSPVATLTSEGKNQSASGTCVDNAGNVSVPAIASGINIDKTGPTLTIASPANGSIVTSSNLTATGTISDALSGLTNVTCNGNAATFTSTSINCGSVLTAGSNSVAFSATDAAGNQTTSNLAVTLSVTPKITITAPGNLSYVNISPTTVSGTVDNPAATVTINSIPAVVSNGTFSVALPLAEGPNIVTATASTGDTAGTASIEVTLDTTPPHVTITSPPDQFVTTDSSISVVGNVNDIVVGTVNDQQAQVTVNSANADVANRTFLAMNVPLAVGPNVIQAVAKDRVGNFATTQITVTRQAVSQAQIRLVSGNNQTGTIGSALSSPLVAAVLDSTNTPVANKPVIFKVTQNDGLVSTGSTPATTVIATTNAQGQAEVQWTLGMRSGAGGNTVEAYSVGFGGTAIFTATGNQGPAGKIVIDSGNDQIGAIGETLPKPLIAVVVDAGNNRLQGVPVTFTIGAGGGSLQGLNTQSAPVSFTTSQDGTTGQQSVTVMSDSDGRVAATLNLGLQEGNANNLVEATFPSNQGFPAAFTASGRAPGDPTKTTIIGTVLDNSNQPIPGVTIRAVLTNLLHSNAASVQSAATVQSNAQGQFTITPAPVGFVKLLVDGSTAQLPGSYPSLEYDVVTVAGQTITIGSPVYLLPLNTNNQLCVTATSGGGTLTIPEAPGFSLTFAPGQVTFPGGSKTGCVSVTVVHGDKVPMVPGFGQQPRFIVTIQPSGAIFNPPAPITLPNVDGLRPREVTEMYSFDHDIGSFVAIGTGRVSDDGQVIRSNAGVGVLKAGWHCGGNPLSLGAAATCSACQRCVGDLCVADHVQDGMSCTQLPQIPGVCSNGGCCSTPSDLANCTNRQQRPLFSPTPDGCSVPSRILAILGPLNGLHYSGDPNNPAGGAHTQFTAACNNHDVCWGTCLKYSQDDTTNRSLCNLDFDNDLHHVCTLALLAGDPASVVDLCNDWADAFSNAVDNNLAGIPLQKYTQAQKEACVCCPLRAP